MSESVEAGPSPAGAGPTGQHGPSAGDDILAEQRVEELVRSQPVFALIKGTPRQPRCGFSASTVAVLDALGVPYGTFDVLADEAVRVAAKRYARWPTFPQVYVRGELVGGNDIVIEMYQTGELQQMVAGSEEQAS